MEREHEPVAPSPAPSVAAPSSAGPSLIGALTPARVLALQRTVGNQAVTALLARDDVTTPTPVTGAGDFGHSGGAPVSSGSVTATPNGSDKVRVQAPSVALDGEAWLKKDKALGGTAYIGIVQNLVHSDRGAVYRHGGDPSGEITAEHHTAEGNKRDAVSDPTNPSRPVSDGPGRITSFKGHDNFKMGLADDRLGRPLGRRHAALPVQRQSRTRPGNGEVQREADRGLTTSSGSRACSP